MFGWLMQGLGWILHVLNNLVNNYGLAIILFTILVKACMFPLTMKQLRSTAKMQELQPKLNALQKKYANDKERFAQEQMKLYREAGTSPFSGCLPTLIQMPILFCLYYAIMYPLENQLWIPENILPTELQTNGYNQLNYLIANPISSFTHDGTTWNWNFDFNFMGIDLGRVASLGEISTKFIELWPNYLLAFLAGLMTYVSMKISNNANNDKKNQKKDSGLQDENPAQGMGSTMQYLMPLMTLWFATAVPSAMALYWVSSNVIQVFQQLLTNAIMKKEKKKVEERLAAEKAESERRKQLFAEEKVALSLHNMSKKKQKRIKEEKKEKDHQERLEKRISEKN